MVARFGGMTRLTDGELFIGKKELCMDPDLYEMQKRKYIKRFQAAIAGMEKERSGESRPAYILYGKILEQLKGMG